MEPSQGCYTLIKQFEKLSLEAYPDPGPAGVTIPTIGYGHTKGVKMGDTCDEPQANAWLEEDVADAVALVDHNFPAVTQGQFDALVSFCFNIGPGIPGKKDGLIWLASGEHSTLMKLTLAGKRAAAADQFPLWNKSGGVVLAGLTKRRFAERALFLS